MTFPFKSRTLAEIDAAPAGLDGHDLTVYNAIATAAATGKSCPSNRTLAALIGKREGQTSHIVRKLARDGFIVIRTRAGYRQVTIAATGLETARTIRNPGKGIQITGVPVAGRSGCQGHHAAILRLYARMAKERGVGMETAMLHAQHGREMVEATTRPA